MRLRDYIDAGGPGSGPRPGESRGDGFPDDHEFKVGDKVSFVHPNMGWLNGKVLSPVKPTLTISYEHPSNFSLGQRRWKEGKADVHHTKVMKPW